jgi:hypothetical protein
MANLFSGIATNRASDFSYCWQAAIARIRPCLLPCRTRNETCDPMPLNPPFRLWIAFVFAGMAQVPELTSANEFPPGRVRSWPDRFPPPETQIPSIASSTLFPHRVIIRLLARYGG